MNFYAFTYAISFFYYSLAWPKRTLGRNFHPEFGLVLGPHCVGLGTEISTWFGLGLQLYLVVVVLKKMKDESIIDSFISCELGCSLSGSSHISPCFFVLIATLLLLHTESILLCQGSPDIFIHVSGAPICRLGNQMQFFQFVWMKFSNTGLTFSWFFFQFYKNLESLTYFLHGFFSIFAWSFVTWFKVVTRI